ncbi:hypothetical protein HS9_00588 [Bacillus velezensis]|nr:hypothetical protein HS9_00588 [Bacillus velezensis]
MYKIILKQFIDNEDNVLLVLLEDVLVWTDECTEEMEND